MHTTSGVDNIDEFLETIERRGGRYYSRRGRQELPVATRTITVAYRTDSGTDRRRFTVYYRRHGSVVSKIGVRWVIVCLIQCPVRALIQ